jgi:hypothetical protein
MSEATDQAIDDPAPATAGATDPTVEELEATVEQLRKDLWTARDAVIGAEAEAGTLKVRNRELEILIAQLRDALAAQTRFARLMGKVTGNRYVSTAITKVKSLLRP